MYVQVTFGGPAYTYWCDGRHRPDVGDLVSVPVPR